MSQASETAAFTLPLAPPRRGYEHHHEALYIILPHPSMKSNSGTARAFSDRGERDHLDFAVPFIAGLPSFNTVRSTEESRHTTEAC
jgi:hypothetical protein